MEVARYSNAVYGLPSVPTDIPGNKKKFIINLMIMLHTVSFPI